MPTCSRFEGQYFAKHVLLVFYLIGVYHNSSVKIEADLTQT